MNDRSAVNRLGETDLIRDFNYYVNKYSKQGYSGEELWKKIIGSSAKPNAKVNNKFNIKNK